MERKWCDVYPRPQLVRDEWMSLDGIWAFSTKKEGEAGMPSETGSIRVPFCPESRLSGVGRRIEADEIMLYGRRFEVPEEWNGKRLIVHFGAVDQTAKIYVDGKYAGSHEGGYLPFSIDITGLLSSNREEDTGKNTDAGFVHSIIVEARDSLDHKYPWGKQKVKNGGMWYTPVSGIWQNVWLEPVPEEHITSLKIDTGADFAEITAFGITGGVLEMDGREYVLACPSEETAGDAAGGPSDDPCGDPSGDAYDNRSGAASGKNFVTGTVCASVRIQIDDPHLWSPEDPYLYEFSITSGGDRIRSYFALRTLTIEWRLGHPMLCLNGEPYFFNGVLDQGYWHDGIYTPSSPDKFADDILAMKSLGFNTLRKHIKIEPDIFYYECDRLGMVVFQDMVNNSDYSFLRDTVLPTIGLTKLSDVKAHSDLDSRRIFRESMTETVKLLYNHPSICYWTIFNEGWGQFDADNAYYRLRAIDKSRFIDSTSGWFRQNMSDVDSYHVYFRKADMKPGERPMVLSEFGGYACRIEGHYFGGAREYGYRKCADTDVLREDIERLYREEIEPLKEKGLCAAIYTQLSDVEDETNGLLTYDRKVMKVSPEKNL